MINEHSNSDEGATRKNLNPTPSSYHRMEGRAIEEDDSS